MTGASVQLMVPFVDIVDLRLQYSDPPKHHKNDVRQTKNLSRGNLVSVSLLVWRSRLYLVLAVVSSVFMCIVAVRHSRVCCRVVRRVRRDVV